MTMAMVMAMAMAMAMTRMTMAEYVNVCVCVIGVMCLLIQVLLIRDLWLIQCQFCMIICMSFFSLIVQAFNFFQGNAHERSEHCLLLLVGALSRAVCG